MFAWFSPRPAPPLPHLELTAGGATYLRPFRDQDAEAFQDAICATLAIPDTSGHMLTFPQPFTRRHARARIRQTHRWLEQGRGWSLTLIHQGQLAGQIQLICALPRRRRAEIAYWIAPAFRGQGLARQGVATLIEAACAHWPLERIEATVVPGNAASIAVLTDLGFTQRELAPVPYRVQGHWRRRSADLLVFAREEQTHHDQSDQIR